MSSGTTTHALTPTTAAMQPVRSYQYSGERNARQPVNRRSSSSRTTQQPATQSFAGLWT
jgi:hypothetical protein